MRSTSPFLQINAVDLWKTVRGGLVTFGGFVLVEGLIALRDGLQTCVDVAANCQFDVSHFSFAVPSLVTVTGMAIELIRRFLTAHK